MFSFILNLFLSYRKMQEDKKELYELLQEYEFRITKLEKRLCAHDKRFDYFDIKIQEVENFQSEVF